MNDTWNVAVTVIPPGGAGPVLLAGAASVLGLALTELDLDCDHYAEQSDIDGATIELVDVVAEGNAAELDAKVTAAVQGLIETTPELAGWSHLVVVAPAALDESELEDLDAEAAALVPDGDRIAEDLLHAIAYEGSVYDAAERFNAWEAADLSVEEDLEALPERDRAAALRRANALAGCLMHAAVVVVDHLFDDIETLRTARQDDEPANVDDCWVLSGLPPRFADRYTSLFAQEFLIALVDVTARFTAGWRPLACVAQELGLRVLLDHVEVVADLADVELDEGWRGHLEDLFFEDLDHEMLYDMAFDGIEDDPSAQPPGMAPMRFEDWFTPFNDGRHLPPYVLRDRQDQ